MSDLLSEFVKTAGKTTGLDAVTYTGKEYKQIYQGIAQLEAENERLLEKIEDLENTLSMLWTEREPADE